MVLRGVRVRGGVGGIIGQKVLCGVVDMVVRWVVKGAFGLRISLVSTV